MHIEHAEIGHFRKLQSVRVDFAETTTVLVGANNSGKTSAMVALRRFLIDRSDFSINDFTLSNWRLIDGLGRSWERTGPEDAKAAFDWGAVLPHLDIWLNVSMEELHYVQKILPTLDWTAGLIGVRLRYEPTDVDILRQDYLAAKEAAENVMQAAVPKEGEGQKAPIKEGFSLWPKSLIDFLSLKLKSQFEVRAYLLDPSKLVLPQKGIASPQSLPIGSEPIEGDALNRIIRIDEIGAQRGFGFSSKAANGEEQNEDAGSRGGKRLSTQLRNYYSQHLDPFDQPEPKDLEALQALHEAQAAFGKRLESCFEAALKELEEIGYPGVTDPKITLTTSIRPVDGLNHASAVQYSVPTHTDEASEAFHRLPEDSNGLGYQNLVSMIFALMSFRDKWMKVGKAAKTANLEEAMIPPIHLVLVEEPEAHLHAQVQQVFITQAYGVLRNHSSLKNSTNLRTQLVVSTHSSHVAHEADFSTLRYFRRLPVKAVAGAVPVSCVVNLSEIFGSEDDTAHFAKRYLKATHCDLFFADGAVLVEGPAERILVPHFVRTRPEFNFLKRCYVTWLEIGGSHAHRLRPLVEHLGLNTLIVTDLDAKDSTNKSVPPERGASLSARNATLKTWLPKEDGLDALLDAKPEKLVLTDESGFGVRVAYQQPIQAELLKGQLGEALANTFEDALVYENIQIFKSLDGSALLGRVRKSLDSAHDLQDLSKRLAVDLSKGGKAEFAMDLLSSSEIGEMSVPAYIKEGLLWLSEQLKRKEDDVSGNVSALTGSATANVQAGQAVA